MRNFLLCTVLISSLIFVGCGQEVRFGRLHLATDSGSSAGEPEIEKTEPPQNDVPRQNPSHLDEIALESTPRNNFIEPAEVGTMKCSREIIAQPIKVLFVVDTSGSNFFSYNKTPGNKCDRQRGCVPATDPSKTFRSSSISRFFEKYKEKPNFSWSFETFSKDSVRSLVSENGSGAFGQPEAMQSAISYFTSQPDRGDTPYLNALKKVRETLSVDPDIQSKVDYPPLYYVVFMSDGYPTDSNISQIDSEVRNIVALNPTQVNFSTIYYGTRNDPAAASILKSMSVMGQGQFINVDTTTTETIAIQDLIKLPTTLCAPEAD
jgi:Mg-chelatase subunit ChlD